MIDIKILREHPGDIEKAARSKKVEVNISHILEIDKKCKELATIVQDLREKRNLFIQTIKVLPAGRQGKPTEEQIKKGKDIKEKLEKEENALRAIEEELNNWLCKIPNPPKLDVEIGKDESENKVLRTWGTPKEFSSKGRPASGWNFKPKDHLELGEALDIIDVKRASKVSGTRFAYLKGDGVLLEMALVQFAFDLLLKEGFIPVLPPVLIKKEIMKGLGYMENGGEEDMFSLDKDDLFLVGTSEQSLVPMHKDEVFNKKDLPLRYVGYSSCFRRESGSYGKDTKGILRVHQFNKIEMVSFVPQGEDDKEHEYLLSLEEKLFQLLKIPYQVIKMCSGDLGFPAARKFDIEAWMPGQGKYREVTSVSTVTDFQSRRLNIKYQDEGDKKYVNVLNGTALAMSRTPIAIMENYQQADGSILIPKVLQKYMGKKIIKSKNKIS